MLIESCCDVAIGNWTSKDFGGGAPRRFSGFSTLTRESLKRIAFAATHLSQLGTRRRQLRNIKSDRIGHRNSDAISGLVSVIEESNLQKH